MAQSLLGPHCGCPKADTHRIQERDAEVIGDPIVDLHERETHVAYNDRLGAILFNGRLGLTSHLLNDFRRLVVHIEHTLFDDANTRQL